ncbi:helix-turn-helix domain-containing protein [Streptomyces sp. NPDC079020]|uniref:helix-turn-helix domain-containing protein n=1 Tax=Streptomyces sp. NPDC079020 TaxID=3365722 RepID=UPI0037CCD694
MLQALGLGRAEEAVYTALLPRSSASAQDLVRQTGLEQAEIARVLRDLAARGLVAVVSDAVGETPGSADRVSDDGPATRYRLTPPSVALAPLLVDQRNALQRAETAFSMLTEQYRSAAAHPAGSVVEVVVGVEQVAHRFHQLQLGAQRELLVFLVGAPTACLARTPTWRRVPHSTAGSNSGSWPPGTTSTGMRWRGTCARPSPRDWNSVSSRTCR